MMLQSATTKTKRVTLLGATGSIGCSTLDLVGHHRDQFDVVAMTANRNAKLVIEQARQFDPEFIAIADADTADQVREALSDTKIEIAAGPDALIEAAKIDSDIVVAGIVGAAGLPATMAAVDRGAAVALANKEALVCAGPLMIDLVANSDALLLPLDSEHNAIFQVFDRANRDAIRRLILTASGGPFRTATLEEMHAVTPEQAVAHPNWSMGAKISVDSATMMNKGLEVIEAHFLFDMPLEQIDVVVHPQSIIHSMVEYSDGSVLAQMGTPDMRTPIAHCLASPDRLEKPGERLDFNTLSALTFEPADEQRFPALRLARQALATGGTAPTILNAANEVAVAAFLAGHIGFTRIADYVEAVLNQADIQPVTALADVFAADEWVRGLPGPQ